VGKSGLATAVELAGGIGELGSEGGDQVELFEPDAPLPMPPAARGKSGPQGGRPKGARNRSTQEWRQYLLGRYRSPLVFLLEAYSRTPAELAAQLGLYKYHEGKLVRGADGEPVLETGEAFKRQVEAAVAALPYLHQRLPIAIEGNVKSAGIHRRLGGAAGPGRWHARADLRAGRLSRPRRNSLTTRSLTAGANR
jgi:hypothetical protein